ncbi:hypothetical protein CXB51_028951 [Gossypium anomalum]|uniref:Amidase domain-containing protein n=1 Tax=Gossypium anomalum TaxID=47600 RepID=A0A8J5YD49_9ROSI|nr:hypothetical protein CXB51_028951 [Gossypium anomalum]
MIYHIALDADFFNDIKVLEIAKGAKEFNIPIIRANRKLVASIDGGLHNPSPLVFNPEWSKEQSQGKASRFNHPSASGIQRPNNEEDIAFMSVLELGELIKKKHITSEEITGIFLKRLRRYNPILESVVSYTEDLAYQQAKEADKLLSQGVHLGPLHGIPYGLKDIISVPLYKTTWGSTTFKNQVLNIEAWVYKRLKSAGVVLVAKLVTRSLAYDDIWFGGRIRNPWNIEEFSTGSSAGPATCTSADPDDLSSRDIPFGDPFSVDITKLTVGYLDDADMEDDDYEAQDQWPVELRRARVVSAVDYLQEKRKQSSKIWRFRMWNINKNEWKSGI